MLKKFWIDLDKNLLFECETSKLTPNQEFHMVESSVFYDYQPLGLYDRTFRAVEAPFFNIGVKEERNGLYAKRDC